MLTYPMHTKHEVQYMNAMIRQASAIERIADALENLAQRSAQGKLDWINDDEELSQYLSEKIEAYQESGSETPFDE